MNLGTQVDLRNDEATLLKLAKRKEKPISNTIGKNLATVSLNQIKNLFKRLEFTRLINQAFIEWHFRFTKILFKLL